MASYDMAALKAELQGQKGLISIVRGYLIPDSETLARRSRPFVDTESRHLSADEMLNQLLKATFDLYIDFEERAFKDFFKVGYKHSDPIKHPIFRDM